MEGVDKVGRAETLKAAPLAGKALADVSQEAAGAEVRVHELADRAHAPPNRALA